MKKESTKKKLIKKLKNKYRLVVLNDESFQEELSFVLSPLNLLLASLGAIVLIVLLTSFVVLYTPVKRYLPGSSYEEVLSTLSQVKQKADSLHYQVESNQLYYQNLKTIINGGVPEDLNIDESGKKIDGKIVGPSDEDAILRDIVEEADKHNIIPLEITSGSPANFSFFTPLKGIISERFNRKIAHLGVDILSSEGSAIKSVLDGAVVFSEWTVETGYVIAIQHQGDIISIYKHNSSLLKKQGDLVKAGDPIAIIGNTGKFTSGPHLHFELWFESTPINPEDYLHI